MVLALIRASEAGAEAAHHGVPEWIYGAGAFGVLMLALFVVTRFDPDR